MKRVSCENSSANSNEQVDSCARTYHGVLSTSSVFYGRTKENGNILHQHRQQLPQEKTYLLLPPVYLNESLNIYQLSTVHGSTSYQTEFFTQL